MAKERIASENITAVNEHGQTVILVPKGQPIPEGVEESKPKTEDKARRSSKKK